MKKCRTCNIHKEYDEFVKQSTCKDGYANRCRLCKKEYDRQYCIKNKEKKRLQMKQRYVDNKERILEYQTEYRGKNKDMISKSSKLYRENNKESLRMSKQEYSDGHKKEKALYDKEYSKNNRGAINARLAKYKAAKKQATPTWLTKEHNVCMKEIYKAAQDLRWEDEMHVDHIIPLRGKTVSGLHVPWNLQIITASENMSKSNRLIQED